MEKKLTNWKDLNREELNSVKGIFLADKWNQNSLHKLAIEYCNTIDSYFKKSNDFIESLVNQFFEKGRVSEKQAFWMAVAYLTVEQES